MPSDRQLLQSCLTPDRLRRLEAVLAARVANVTVVLENLHKDYNISAIMRSCEAFGIQEVNVVPQPGEGRIFRSVTQGCHGWLTVHRHRDVASCFRTLRGRGFRILAGVLGEGAVPLAEMEFPGRVALVFSNELNGAGGEVTDKVDGSFIIPLAGFSQSLNVSVAAGIALNRILEWKGQRAGEIERIPAGEAAKILEKWVRRSVKRSDAVLKELRSRR
ncbi:MAG: RNA methyltransferase [bacterium]|nr:MAG: RNA methyltransferase [bacterium]